MNTNIKRTRMTASGYTRPRYVCFDCGQTTASVMLVYRGGYAAHNKVFVHRPGSGCHKQHNSNEVYGMVN